MTNKTRKIYTGEFKTAAFKLVAEGKQSVPEASKSLGIGESTLFKWIDQLKPSDEIDSKCIKVNDELQWLLSKVIELKKKLALAEEHREIFIPTYIDSSTIASKFFVFNTNNMSLNCSHISGL